MAALGPSDQSKNVRGLSEQLQSPAARPKKTVTWGADTVISIDTKEEIAKQSREPSTLEKIINWLIEVWDSIFSSSTQEQTSSLPGQHEISNLHNSNPKLSAEDLQKAAELFQTKDYLKTPANPADIEANLLRNPILSRTPAQIKEDAALPQLGLSTYKVTTISQKVLNALQSVDVSSLSRPPKSVNEVMQEQMKKEAQTSLRNMTENEKKRRRDLNPPPDVDIDALNAKLKYEAELKAGVYTLEGHHKSKGLTDEPS